MSRGTELAADGPTYFLVRTGVIWLFFAAVEAAALASLRPALVALVAALHLMDVPADLAYFAAAGDLVDVGRFGLLFSPAFNLCAGVRLAMLARRSDCVRSGPTVTI